MIAHSIARKKFLTPRGRIEIDGQCNFSVFLDSSRCKESVQIRKIAFGVSTSTFSCGAENKNDTGSNEGELAPEVAPEKQTSKHDDSIHNALVWLQQDGHGNRYSIWQSFCDETNSELLMATYAKQTFKALRPTMMGLWILCIYFFSYYLWQICLWSSGVYVDVTLPYLRFFLVPLLVFTQFRRYRKLIMIQQKRYEKAMNKLQFIAMRKNIEQNEIIFSVSCNEPCNEISVGAHCFKKTSRNKKYKIDIFEPRMMESTHPDYHLYHSNPRIKDCKLRVGMDEYSADVPSSTIVCGGGKTVDKTVHVADDEDEASTTSTETSSDEEKGGESSLHCENVGDWIDSSPFCEEDEDSSSIENRKFYNKRHDSFKKRPKVHSKSSSIRNWPYIYQ